MSAFIIGLLIGTAYISIPNEYFEELTDLTEI